MDKLLYNDIYSLPRKESERVYILKVWFSIMVIFVHSYGESVNFAGGSISLIAPHWLKYTKIIVSNIVAICSVSGFFFLSAFFLYLKPFSWRDNFIKKCRSIIVPYLLINTFWIAVVFLAQHIPVFAEFFSNPALIIADWNLNDWISAYLGSQANRFPFLYPLWFLRDLFVMNILAKLIEKVVCVLSNYSLILFLLLWLLVDSSHVFFCDIRAICFWGLGCFFAKSKHSLSCFDNMNRFVLSAVYACLILATTMMIDSRSLGELILYRACIAVGIIFWYACTTDINSKIKPVLIRISNYSFLIYLFHELSLTALKKLLARLLPANPLFQFAEYIGIPVFIFIYCLTLCLILEKISPRLFSLLNGKRSYANITTDKRKEPVTFTSPYL